jgi:hypothetical protein
MEKKKFKRVYHPYWEWEEVPYNMWGTVENKKEWVQRAIEFTGNHNLYGSYMMRVIQEWPISCENALTDSSLNRRAWVGHAAVALALQCPEDIVREAWKHLSYEQQLLANKEADGAIAAWEQSYIKDKGLQPAMGGSMLF